MVSEEVLQAAALRGTKIHQYIAAKLMNLYLPERIEPHLQPYFDSFASWYEQTVERTLYVEIEAFCTCFQFIGHIDWVGIIRGDQGLTILDWKTPVTEAKSWIMQLSAYLHLIEEHTDTDLSVIRCGAIMLDPKGKMAKMKEYTDVSAAAFNAFVGLLGGLRWLNDL